MHYMLKPVQITCLLAHLNIYFTTLHCKLKIQNVQILVEKYIFIIFAYEHFKFEMKKCKQYQKYIYLGRKYF